MRQNPDHIIWDLLGYGRLKDFGWLVPWRGRVAFVEQFAAFIASCIWRGAHFRLGGHDRGHGGAVALGHAGRSGLQRIGCASDGWLCSALGRHGQVKPLELLMLYPPQRRCALGRNRNFKIRDRIAQPIAGREKRSKGGRRKTQNVALFCPYET
jgi:hypothetical protein